MKQQTSSTDTRQNLETASAELAAAEAAFAASPVDKGWPRVTSARDAVERARIVHDAAVKREEIEAASAAEAERQKKIEEIATLEAKHGPERAEKTAAHAKALAELYSAARDHVEALRAENKDAALAHDRINNLRESLGLDRVAYVDRFYTVKNAVRSAIRDATPPHLSDLGEWLQRAHGVPQSTELSLDPDQDVGPVGHVDSRAAE